MFILKVYSISGSLCNSVWEYSLVSRSISLSASWSFVQKADRQEGSRGGGHCSAQLHSANCHQLTQTHKFFLIPGKLHTSKFFYCIVCKVFSVFVSCYKVIIYYYYHIMKVKLYLPNVTTDSDCPRGRVTSSRARFLPASSDNQLLPCSGTETTVLLNNV